MRRTHRAEPDGLALDLDLAIHATVSTEERAKQFGASATDQPSDPEHFAGAHLEGHRAHDSVPAQVCHA